MEIFYAPSPPPFSLNEKGELYAVASKYLSYNLVCNYESDNLLMTNAKDISIYVALGDAVNLLMRESLIHIKNIGFPFYERNEFIDEFLSYRTIPEHLDTIWENENFCIKLYYDVDSAKIVTLIYDFHQQTGKSFILHSNINI